MATFTEFLQQLPPAADITGDNVFTLLEAGFLLIVEREPIEHNLLLRQLAQRIKQPLGPLRKQLDAMLKDYRRQEQDAAKAEEEPKAQRGGAELTDLGNSFRLLQHCTVDGELHVRWCETSGEYYVYTDGRWQRRGTSMVRRIAAKMMVDELVVAREVKDKELEFWLLASQSRRALDATVELLRDRGGVVVPRDRRVWDQHPWLINFKNGTFDLETGKLRDHRAADALTQMIHHNYVEDARCPTWLRFLETSLPDLEIREWIRRRDGSNLTGSGRDQVVAVHYGPGGGGKGTHLETLQWVEPDYCTKLHRSCFERTKNDPHPTNMMDAKGKRLVFGAEINKHLSVNQIKELSGQDTIKARGMNQDFQTLAPTWNTEMMMNDQPVIPEVVSDGIWDRVRVIPWTQRFRGTDRQDKNLGDKLKAEAEGILAWQVQGALDWLKDGLPDVKAIRLATSEVQEANNSVKRFLDELCPGHNPRDGDRVIDAARLWQLRRDWNEDANERRHETQTSFGLALGALGYEHAAPHSRTRRSRWKGISEGGEVQPTHAEMVADQESLAQEMARLDLAETTARLEEL